MATSAPVSPGFLAALRALGDGVLATVQQRLELVSIELQEEKFRLIRTFVWISAAVFSGMMAMVFGSLALVYLFWESARLPVLGGLALFYAGALVATLWGLRRCLARQSPPFAGTLRELGEDRECIRNGN